MPFESLQRLGRVLTLALKENIQNNVYDLSSESSGIKVGMPPSGCLGHTSRSVSSTRNVYPFHFVFCGTCGPKAFERTVIRFRALQIFT